MSTALALLFGVAVAVSRMDFAISRDAKYQARQEHERLVDVVQRLDAALRDRRAVLRDLDVAAATKPVAECGEAKAAAEASFKASDAVLKKLVAEIAAVGGRQGEQFGKLVEEERALVQSSLALFVKKVELVKQGAKAAVCVHP